MKEKTKIARWEDPVRGRAPKESTMQTEGDFSQFTALMKRVVKIRPPREAKPISASPGPAASA
jgi:hypothetical protein